MTIQRDRILGRISALALLAFSFTFALRGMQGTTSAPGEHAHVVCGIMGCSGNNPSSQAVHSSSHGGGGGAIRISP